MLQRVRYHPQPYIPLSQIRDKEGLTKGYPGLLLALLGWWVYIAGGGIGLYEYFCLGGPGILRPPSSTWRNPVAASTDGP